MLVHNRIENSAANGPGNRAVIWTQGCSLHCKGCWNSGTHNFEVASEIDTDHLVDWVLGLPDIEGVTFSGGEPFQQAGSLWYFCKRVKDRRPDFSIAAYTGYTLEQLLAGQWKHSLVHYGTWHQGTERTARQILEMMDFLVAGRFNAALRCEDKPLCGSRNQQVRFLTSRYSQKDLTPNVIEIIIDPDADLLQITGFPSNVDALTAE
jgi:anaerobic ribonucleoside-triphosphate reductase activating protein